MRRMLNVISMAGLLAVIVAAAPLEGVWAEVEGVMPEVMEGGTVSAIATVKDIDVNSRQVTLEGKDGKTVTITAGPEVRNFDRINTGDQVVAEYYEGLAVAVVPKGTAVEAREDTVSVARAKEGDKPAAAITKTVNLEAKVVGLNREERLVAVQGPERTVVMKVSDEVDLEGVNVGDTVVATFIEGFAIAVLMPEDAAAEVQVSVTAVAVGIGVQWGSGTLTLKDGTTHKIKVTGLSLADVGVATVKADGYVYHMDDVAEFPGTYVAGAAGITLGGGGSSAVLKNSKGVLIRVNTRQEGLRLTVALSGMQVKLAD